MITAITLSLALSSAPQPDICGDPPDPAVDHACQLIEHADGDSDSQLRAARIALGLQSLQTGDLLTATAAFQAAHADDYPNAPNWQVAPLVAYAHMRGEYYGPSMIALEEAKALYYVAMGEWTCENETGGIGGMSGFWNRQRHEARVWVRMCGDIFEDDFGPDNVTATTHSYVAAMEWIEARLDERTP